MPSGSSSHFYGSIGQAPSPNVDEETKLKRKGWRDKIVDREKEYCECGHSELHHVNRKKRQSGKRKNCLTKYCRCQKFKLKDAFEVESE